MLFGTSTNTKSSQQSPADGQLNEFMHMRRRVPPPRTTQMGSPLPRARSEKSKPVLEWMKAIILCLVLISVFMIIVLHRKSRHLLRKTSNFSNLDRCNISSYPLWKIDELQELVLSMCEHHELPNDYELWSRFKSLKKLDLSSNNLRKLPLAMEALSSSLQILFLSENKFDEIPAVIKRFTHLRVLSLRGNFLSELSSTNLPTSSLVWLIFTNNRIATINKNIQDLRLLRKLMLSHNYLASIPLELGECKALELIRLSNNNLASIPNEILLLPKLAWISLSGNPMCKTPDNLEKVINEKEIQIEKSKELGKGASGTVYFGIYNGNNVAVKLFKGQSKGSDGKAEDEMAINSLVTHPFAISATGVIESGTEKVRKGIVMELLKGIYPLGNVPNFDTVTRDEGPSRDSKYMDENAVFRVIWNISVVLQYIHSSISVSHGDVYLHNVLMDEEGFARLSDWGASFMYDRNNSQQAELFEKIEVLAFGRLIQNLMDWHLDKAVPDTTELSALRAEQKAMTKGPMRDLIAQIIQPDPMARPNFEEINKKLKTLTEMSLIAFAN